MRHHKPDEGGCCTWSLDAGAPILLGYDRCCLLLAGSNDVWSGGLVTTSEPLCGVPSVNHVSGLPDLSRDSAHPPGGSVDKWLMTWITQFNL